MEEFRVRKLENIELNEQLYRVISADVIDYEKIAELMAQGADPLGPLKDELETPLSEFFSDEGSYWDECDCSEGKRSDRLPKVLEKMLENGFDCTRFKSSADGEHDLELWGLGLGGASEGTCNVLKILIENGLDVKALEDFVEHIVNDDELASCNMYGDEVFCAAHQWDYRAIMLCASYPDVLKKSGFIADCIEMNTTNAESTYDLTKFRDFEKYDYTFDTSTIEPDTLGGATVTVTERATGQIVWKMHV